jgi:hypothetical protein
VPATVVHWGQLWKTSHFLNLTCVLGVLGTAEGKCDCVTSNSNFRLLSRSATRLWGLALHSSQRLISIVKLDSLCCSQSPP